MVSLLKVCGFDWSSPTGTGLLGNDKQGEKEDQVKVYSCWQGVLTKVRIIKLYYQSMAQLDRPTPAWKQHVDCQVVYREAHLLALGVVSFDGKWYTKKKAEAA